MVTNVIKDGGFETPMLGALIPLACLGFLSSNQEDR